MDYLVPGPGRFFLFVLCMFLLLSMAKGGPDEWEPSLLNRVGTGILTKWQVYKKWDSNGKRCDEHNKNCNDCVRRCVQSVSPTTMTTTIVYLYRFPFVPQWESTCIVSSAMRRKTIVTEQIEIQQNNSPIDSRTISCNTNTIILIIWFLLLLFVLIFW